jgi:hypothetical protein
LTRESREIQACRACHLPATAHARRLSPAFIKLPSKDCS